MKIPILFISMLACTACSSVNFSEDEPNLDNCIQIGSVAGKGSNSHEIEYDLVQKARSMGGNHIVAARDSTDFLIVQTPPPADIIYSPEDLRDSLRSENLGPTIQTFMVAYVYYCK